MRVARDSSARSLPPPTRTRTAAFIRIPYTRIGLWRTRVHVFTPLSSSTTMHISTLPLLPLTVLLLSALGEQLMHVCVEEQITYTVERPGLEICSCTYITVYPGVYLCTRTRVGVGLLSSSWSLCTLAARTFTYAVPVGVYISITLILYSLYERVCFTVGR